MFYAAARTHTHTHTYTLTRVAPTHMSAACEEPTKRGAQEQQQQRAAEGPAAAAAGPSQGPTGRVEEQQLQQRALPRTARTRPGRLGGVWCCRPCSACNYLMALAFSASAVVLHLAPCNKLSYQVSLMYTPSAPARQATSQAVGARLNL